ncbi:MAG: SHOCT domain-containing protein [Actinomycetes bacterium]
MRLAPRQLQRAGMTGAVPYYGGRLSPSQAYAVSHQANVVPPEGRPAAGTAAGGLTEKLATLQHLLDDGVITDAEYRAFRERVLQ